MKMKRAGFIYGILLSGLMIILAGCSAGDAAMAEKEEVNENVQTTEKDSQAAEDTEKEEIVITDVVLEKSPYKNPIIDMMDEKGDRVYGGDPAVLVDGDTVYLYTGHDMSTDKEVSTATYHIPEYLCYSSKDLIDWNYEGVVMSMTDVEWSKDSTSAWASQVAKHKDPGTGTDKYYLYYCTWGAAKVAAGKQCIGVAVSDSPTGPFVDIGQPLVNASLTKPQTSNWNDIDPTVWVETGEDGQEHRYLAWGNGLFYICELNEDMISVKDLNGDGEISGGMKAGECDILNRTMGLTNYTEAPWIYRRQDENGDYTGDYYLFHATEWRESMGYVRTDDLFEGEWRDYTIFMAPTATGNTNHEAIFDFKGKTYMMYHDGAGAGGNGYRRNACLQELVFDDDGRVEFMEESTAGLAGSCVTIECNDGSLLSHEAFVCSTDDSAYPYVDVAVGAGLSDEENDGKWVLAAGKSGPEDDSHVSIIAENKTGLWISAFESGGKAVIAQDTDAGEDTAKAQTFKSVTALNGDEGKVSLESLAFPGEYLYIDADRSLALSGEPDADAASFSVK